VDVTRTMMLADAPKATASVGLEEAGTKFVPPSTLMETEKPAGTVGAENV
jgi:hypothetical protein